MWTLTHDAQQDYNTQADTLANITDGSQLIKLVAKLDKRKPREYHFADNHDNRPQCAT